MSHHGLRALELGTAAEQLDPATPVEHVEALFRSQPELRAVVTRAGERWRILTRHHLDALLSGRLGYGRALLVRATLVDLAQPDVLLVGEDAALHVIAEEILARPAARRWEDVLVATSSGPLHLVPVSPVLAEVSRRHEVQAGTDPLTGLPNRRSLKAHLDGRLAYGTPTAVVFLDLDRFKAVNDSLGHEAGDAVLREVARRLRRNLASSEVFARLSGDEFVLVVDDVARALQVTEVAASALGEPHLLDGRGFVVSASMGIASSEPHDGARELLGRADHAMYQAKRSGSRVRVYDPSSDGHTDELELTSQLRLAIEDGALEVHYQPLVALSSGALGGFEALLRWTGPDGRQVPPTEVIPVAEATGLIGAVGRLVLDRACLQARLWQSSADRGRVLTVSVNLSPRQLEDDRIVIEVQAALARNDLPAEALCLEVTESAAMTDLDATVRRLTALKEVGVRLALDDFGTGHSSLAVLRQLPVDVVKVDKAFLHDVADQSVGARVLGHLIDLAHTLDLSVTVEGVETDEQAALVRRLGADTGQGWLFGRPTAASSLDVAALSWPWLRCVS